MPIKSLTELVEPANTHYALSDGIDVSLSASLPDDLGRMQGVWCGTWGGHIPQIVVIDHIQKNGDARVVYAWGDSIHGTRNSKERHANLSTGKIEIDLPDGNVSLRLTAAHRMFGLYEEDNQVRNCITLYKIADNRFHDKTTIRPLRVPIGGKGRFDDKSRGLYCTVYRNPDLPKAPLLILSHGSAAGATGPVVTWLYDAQARYFVREGFTVVVAMRRGRGKSDGPFVETGSEDSSEFCEMEVSAGLADLLAVIDYVRGKPWIAEEPVVLAGQSRGGFLSLAAAAQRPEQIRAVINFSGGWWDEESAATPWQLRKLSEAGAAYSKPTLWLYGDSDFLYGLEHIHKLHNAFVTAGGTANLQLFPSVGHELIDCVHLWEAHVGKFITSLN